MDRPGDRQPNGAPACAVGKKLDGIGVSRKKRPFVGGAGTYEGREE
jgi:hypothetical protein